MRTIGFDPSLTNFGWAIYDTEGEGEGHCPARGRFQTSSKQLFVDRYVEMRANVLALLSAQGVRRVGCEYPIFHELWSEGMYGLFLFTCEAMREAGVDVVFLSPHQIKAHARAFLERPLVGGKLWVMQKPDMVDAAREATGGRGRWNHNEADAFWAARAASRFWQFLDGEIGEADLTTEETKQFRDIHTYQRGKHAGETKMRGLLYREDERFFRWAKDDQK